MITRKLSLSIVLVLSLGLVLAGVVYAAGNIDAANKYAWGSNVGWINFNPTHGGVTVYADHLEGYAWAENIGWIRLGTCTGGSPCTYANTSPTNYGVNRAADGKLSGYAWSTTAGWIKFNPTHGGVTVDPATGAFNGYAWAENVGWIHFKGGAGATAYGVVTSFGGSTPSQPLNLALDFDGSNDYVTIADADSLDLTSNYTLEAWIYPNSFGYLEGIISKYHTNNANGYTLRVTASGGIDFDQMSTAGGLLTPNQWYHIAAVNSGGTRSLYINGLPVTLSGTPITVGANNNPVRIGQDFGTTGPARYFDGLIDEARIWNTARTAQQIRENMARALLGSETGLVGYWRMDYGLPGSANPGLTTLPDLTANNHDGALTNFALSGNTSNWVGSTAFNTWFGSYDTAWATGGNWSRNAAPAASDTVGVYSYGGYNPAIGAAANARDLIIASGGVLTVNGSNTLNIGSRFINYGTFTSNSSSVVFNGSGSQYLILGAATAFNHLTVNAGVTLIETEAANNATVNGTLTNHGVIRKVQAIPTTGAYTFGLAGGPVNGANVGLNVTGDSFSAIQVDRRDNSHPSAPSKIQTGRYWTITPSGTGTVNLTLPATFTADSSSQVCRYTGSGQVWDCARTSNTANSVTRDGVTTFSDWAVSQETVKTYLPFIIK